MSFDCRARLLFKFTHKNVANADVKPVYVYVFDRMRRPGPVVNILCLLLILVESQAKFVQLVLVLACVRLSISA